MTYKTRDYQSVYDLAIQLYGDFSRIDEILPIIRNLGSKIPVGTEIEYTPSLDPVSRFFYNRIVAVATYEDTILSVSRRLLETGEFRLLETGDFRLLE